MSFLQKNTLGINIHYQHLRLSMRHIPLLALCVPTLKYFFYNVKIVVSSLCQDGCIGWLKFLAKVVSYRGV